MKFKVNLWEHERGWGSKIDEVKYFDSNDYEGDSDKALSAAKEFVKEFNKDNTLPQAPDWYMVADAPELVQ
jgi:hypothetical protein